MKHVSLDQEDDHIKRFVRSLPIDPDGSILEIDGEPVFRVLPMGELPIDEKKLKAAIRKRRAASRAINK